MNHRSFAIRLAAIVALAVVAIMWLGATESHARAVALSDAATPPTNLVLVGAHESVNFALAHDGTVYNCGEDRYGWFSDVSAYRWNGRALGDQRWNRAHDRTYWRDPRGGRVVFDGVTFVNRTSYPVLVAGWCE